MRSTRPPLALALGVALAAGLAACGGGSSSSSSSTASSTPTTATNTAEPSGKSDAAKTAEPSGKSDAAKTAEPSGKSDSSLTPPGRRLAFGQEARVGWVPPSTFSASGGQQGIGLGVSVAAIEEGTLADFKGIELEPGQSQSTPFYVKVEIKALSGTAPPSSDDPALTFTAIDDRGQEQGSITFIGDFPRCEEEDPPKPFINGKSFESCLTYLMPGGGSIQSVEWAEGPSKPNQVTPYFEHPLAWEGS